MIRTLEIAWLCITILSIFLAIFQYFHEGWESSLWMIFISGIAMVMYMVRRKQRIHFQKKEEDVMKYH